MLIQVNYSDNTFDYVKDKSLNALIEADKVKMFRRTSGWATIGVDPLRKSERSDSFERPKPSKKLIRVEYSDNRFDYVWNNELDKLIETKQVVKFQRESGWATVGVDPIRKISRG